MRRHVHTCRKTGLILAASGATIIIFLVLPIWAWWFLLGVGLLITGIFVLKG